MNRLTLNKDVYRKSCQSYLQGLADDMYESEVALAKSRHPIITESLTFMFDEDFVEFKLSLEQAQRKFFKEYARIIKEFVDE